MEKLAGLLISPLVTLGLMEISSNRKVTGLPSTSIWEGVDGNFQRTVLGWLQVKVENPVWQKFFLSTRSLKPARPK
jgi:hypothetical protein